MTANQNLQSAAILCEHIAIGKSPILHAERSEPEDEADSGWQFVCGKKNENWKKAQVWSVQEVLNLDSSLTVLVELPIGTILQRKNSHEPWAVSH